MVFLKRLEQFQPVVRWYFASVVTVSTIGLSVS